MSDELAAENKQNSKNNNIQHTWTYFSLFFPSVSLVNFEQVNILKLAA